jgi:RNA polymerase sigma-70 factor, ECF subfamily
MQLDPSPHPASEAGVSAPGAGAAVLPAQFRRVYEQELTYVWTTLRRLGVAERDLEDVAHELFVTLYPRLGEYDASRPLRPWLLAFAFRIASDYRRRKSRHPETSHDEVEIVDPARAADERLGAEQDRALVLEALETLGPDRRAVFIMHEIDEFTVPQIADALAVPLNTVYSRLGRARTDFVEAIRRLNARRRRS